MQVICAALKKYGMFVADNGLDWYISGAPDCRWSDDNLGDLKDITGDAFEVADTGEHLITDQPYGDNDGDGYINGTEERIGTGEGDPCGGNGWPSDLVPGGLAANSLNVQDLASFVTPVRQIGKSSGDPGVQRALRPCPRNKHRGCAQQHHGCRSAGNRRNGQSADIRRAARVRSDVPFFAVRARVRT